MSSENIYAILQAIRNNYDVLDDVEITLEANPDTITEQKLYDFKYLGINRISLGIQSFIDSELQFLGRRCNAKTNKYAASLVSNVFENHSLDLIYGFEGQTLDSIKESIEISMSFNPKHISCYKLTFEEGTPLFKQMEEDVTKDISEDDDIAMLEAISRTLANNGFTRYEISNYAKPGYESKHNFIYWNYEDYLGIGPAAHSRITLHERKTAIENPCNIQEWLNELQTRYILSPTDEATEAIIMGLRTNNGVASKYARMFDMSSVHQYLTLESDRIKIKPKYMDLCDGIIDTMLC